jgi:hypothetical protein
LTKRFSYYVQLTHFSLLFVTSLSALIGWKGLEVIVVHKCT